MSVFEIIKADHARIADGENPSIFDVALAYLRKKHFRPIVTYRICQSFKNDPTVLKKLVSPVFKIIHRLNCGALCMELPLSCEIGEGLRIFHGYGLVINSGVKIGRSVTLMHHVTIGSNGKGVPSIGDGVEIGTHSVILGPIKLGNGCVIGAGVIVVKDVPSNAVLVGQAPRFIKIQNA